MEDNNIKEENIEEGKRQKDEEMNNELAKNVNISFQKEIFQSEVAK